MTRFNPSGPLRGTLRPPPDKSISHRAALIAAMGEGDTEVRGYLDAADTRSTLEAIRRLGAEVSPRVEKPGTVPRNSTLGGGIDLGVRGVGLRGPLPGQIDVGNAGTLLRILPGWLAGQGKGSWTLDGDESIRRRPVDRIAEPLRRMGATITCRESRFAPLTVDGGELHGISYELPVASAQVKSCLLLAGLLADAETQVTEPGPTRDHTERMLEAAGADVEVTELRRALPGEAQGRRVTVRPATVIDPPSIEVPGDFSSAAFWLVAATIVPRSHVSIEGVGLNPTRIGLLGILNRMGAAIEVTNESPAAVGEPEGSIAARHSSLAATRVHAAEVSLAIDELPLVGLLGCFAEGETFVSGAEELRHKESDRINAVVEGLRGLGADIDATPDGFSVRGTGSLHGGQLDSRGDHRLAMLGAIAGLASSAGVEVIGMESAGISYPGFEADLASLVKGGA